MELFQQWAAALLVPLLLFYYLHSLRRNTRKNCQNSPPEPTGAWPIVGHSLMLLGPQLPHVTLGAMADEYGPAFTIKFGLHRVLVVNSWEVAKECFTTNDKIFATRPKSVAIELMGYKYAMFGFSPYGTYWRKLRKITAIDLLSSRPIELLRNVWISEIDRSVKDLYRVCESKQTLVDMRQCFSNLTLNVVLRMVAGKTVEEAKGFEMAVQEFSRAGAMIGLWDALPFLRFLDLQGHGKAMKNVDRELDAMLAEWLKEHHRDGTKNDFMSILLSELEEAKPFDYEVDTIVKATCLTLILGSNDSAMVTLTWALALLLNNPTILKKAQDEIDIHIGRDRVVDESDIKKLPFLQAIVKETLRLYPPFPLAPPHEATEDCTVAGYTVPAGTRLIVNVWKIQRDPRVYSDPDEFQPERFLTKQANVDVRGHDYELIPFGSGRRVCPGISFALQVLHLTLARLLQGFEFEIPQDAPTDMTERIGLIKLTATSLELLLAPRLPLHLY